MALKHNGMILVLNDFNNLDQREREIQAALFDAGNYLIVDLSNTTRIAPDHVFNDVVYFARDTREHLQRKGRKLPQTAYVLPSHFTLAQERLALLSEKAGIPIEVVETREEAEHHFAVEINWKIYDIRKP